MSPEEQEEAAPDAIALFRPKNKSMILPFLDLDDSEESDGLYAEELEDGSFLVHTFQPFGVFEANPHEARVWLEQFGRVLPEVHDDPRGLLFFPDDNEPESMTYDAVVTEVGEDGVWIALTEVDDDEDGRLDDLQGTPPIDMDMLHAFAGQLMGDVDESGAPRAVTSFDVGQMFEQMQRGLLDTLTAEATKMQQGAEGAPSEPSRAEDAAEGTAEVIDEEFAPDPTPPRTKKK